MTAQYLKSAFFSVGSVGNSPDWSVDACACTPAGVRLFNGAPTGGVAYAQPPAAVNPSGSSGDWPF